jgi:hypothetical protein
MNFEKYEKFFKVINLLIIPFLSSLPLITHSYGLDNYFCTYIPSKTGNLWRYGLILIPGWFFSISSIFFYIRVFRKARSLGLQSSTKAMLERVVFYPIVLFVSLFGITILRTLQIFEVLSTCNLFIFYAIVESLFSLQGFFNSLIFFLTPSVQSSLKDSFSKTFRDKNISLIKCDQVEVDSFEEATVFAFT